MATVTATDASPTGSAAPVRITTGEQNSSPSFDSATETVDDTWTGIGPTDAGGGDNGQNAIKFILPVIGVLIGVFFLICVFIYRHSYIKRRNEARRQAANDEWVGGNAVLAEELASGVRTPNGSRRHDAAGDMASTGPGGGLQGARRNHRRVRGLRRQESGATIRTLPEYSKEAGDEEVVLVRRQSKSSTTSSRPPTPTQNPYRRPSVAELISGSVATAVRRTASLLSISSNANSASHAHAHNTNQPRAGSSAGRASGSTPEPLHVAVQGQGHMPPVMETIQTAALDDRDEDRESREDGVGNGNGRGEMSPRSSTSSGSTITPLQRQSAVLGYNDAESASARGSATDMAIINGAIGSRSDGNSGQSARTAPPYHPTRTTTSLSTGIWRGDAPTYLEAMSTPDLAIDADDANSGTVPLPVNGQNGRQTIRGRTSESIRNLLHRTHLLPHRAPASSSRSGLLPLHLRNASGSSTLLLRPMPSRTSVPPSPRTSGRHRNGPHESTLSPDSLSSPPVDSRTRNNPYRHSLAASSFHTPRNSSYSLVIGSPIPSTAVRAGFNVEDLPRAGLSEHQMRFLASSEAVDLLGVRMDTPPKARGSGRGHVRSRSEGATLAEAGLNVDGIQAGGGGQTGDDDDAADMGNGPASAPILDRAVSRASRRSVLGEENRTLASGSMSADSASVR